MPQLRNTMKYFETARYLQKCQRPQTDERITGDAFKWIVIQDSEEKKNNTRKEVSFTKCLPQEYIVMTP